MTCHHLVNSRCNLITQGTYNPPPEICRGCNRQPNEILTNIALAFVSDNCPGVGDIIQDSIPWFNRYSSCGSCGDRIETINSWTLDECVENKREILQAIRESAMDKGVEYSEFTISAIVDAIIWRCREVSSRSNSSQ